MLRQIYELRAPESGMRQVILTGLVDKRPAGPLASLEFPLLIAGDPEGEALLEMPSGRPLLVKDHRLFIEGGFTVRGFGPDSEAPDVLAEFLREADLTSANLVEVPPGKADQLMPINRLSRIAAFFPGVGA